MQITCIRLYNKASLWASGFYERRGQYTESNCIICIFPLTMSFWPTCRHVQINGSNSSQLTVVNKKSSHDIYTPSLKTKWLNIHVSYTRKCLNKHLISLLPCWLFGAVSNRQRWRRQVKSGKGRESGTGEGEVHSVLAIRCPVSDRRPIEKVGEMRRKAIDTK